MGRWKDRLQRAMTVEYWRICYRKRVERPDGSGPGSASNLLWEDRAEGFYPVPGPKYVTMADPFLYRYHGCTYLFYEKQNLTDMKGSLWSRNLDIPGEKPRKVLEEPFHLSYPQIFQYGKYTYMIPETRGAGQVRLYRCLLFPGSWELVGCLFQTNAVDTTLVETKPGTFTFFLYVDHHMEVWQGESLGDRLDLPDKVCLYSSEDSKTVRCGGSLLREEDHLYRVCQDCSQIYGGGLIINEVDHISRDDFREHTIKRIGADEVRVQGLNPVGIHTYNRNDYYEVIDVLHREISWKVLFKKLYWKLRGGH